MLRGERVIYVIILSRNVEMSKYRVSESDYLKWDMFEDVECGWRSLNEPTKWTMVTNQGTAPEKAPPMLKLERGWIWNMIMELLRENMGAKKNLLH